MKKRSKGSFLLARAGQTDEAIGIKLGVTRINVTAWRIGKQVPQTRTRIKMLDLLGIPIAAWDEPSEGQALAPLAPAPPPVAAKALVKQTKTALAASTPATVTERVIAVEGLIDSLMMTITTDTTSTPHEQAKVLTLLSTSLAQLRRLKGEEIPEVKVTRHPAWVRLKGELLTTLKRFPDALRAVKADVDAAEAAER